jgi:signal transduction histidine kinase
VTDSPVGRATARYQLTGWRRVVRSAYQRLRPRRIGLRNRILLLFGTGALILAAVLAFTTYGLTRSNLVQQRESASINQAVINARRAQIDLTIAPENLDAAIDQVGTAQRALYMDGEWATSSLQFTERNIPQELLDRVIVDRVAAEMIVPYRNGQALIVGIPLPSVEASYFELDNLRDIRDALQTLQVALGVAALLTTMVGVGFGLFASRRAVRPLANAASAARAIADGKLDTRLEATDDPDLMALTESFNDMVGALQQRMDRDARFTSDVSHELRSPLMTLAASVEVMQSRRDEMSERTQAALDLLTSDVARFQGLVEDLLEISRFDAGAIRLVLEPLDLVEFVRQAVAASSLPRTEILVLDRLDDATIRGDRRRLARVLANLIDNARIHSGGTPGVIVQRAPNTANCAWIVVEDDGDGLIEGEEQAIFERFSRGGTAGRRAGQEGAGLGLALALEHVTMHGGRIWAENRRDGIRGARFTVELLLDSSYDASNGPHDPVPAHEVSQ